MELDRLRLLGELAVLNRDDGRTFTKVGRLDAVERVLSHTPYRRVNSQGLFHLYSRRPLCELPGELLLVSSHVDCEAGMNRCFVEEAGDGLLRGSFDNLATNAAIVELMLDGTLPDSTVVVFTGDEERGSSGARQTCGYIRQQEKVADMAVVLDVTDMGWDDRLDATVENDFCDAALISRLCGAVSKATDAWRVVPAEAGRSYPGVDEGRVALVPAMPDETWAYDEMGVPCFSLCVPVKGNIHSGEGVLMRKDSFDSYVKALRRVVSHLAGNGRSV